MNKQNITIVALAAFLAIGMATVAFAGPGQGRFGPRGDGFKRNGAYSQLTPEKQKAVDVIYDKYESKFDELQTGMWVKRSVLQAMINGGDANEKKISGLVRDINELRNEMRDTRAAMQAELEKETGIVGFGGQGPRFAGKRGPHMGVDQGSGRPMGFNQGRGRGDCLSGPCWN